MRKNYIIILGISSDLTLIDEYENKPFTCVFATYAVGKANQKAYSAAKAVAKSPGSPINPLLILGSNGLGKTHLIEAIGAEIKDKNPGAVIRYKSAEMFRDQLADYIARGEYERFMSRIYSTDIFLIDDLQDLNTSKVAQRGIVTIMDHLIRKGRQVVLTCDCPVSDLTWLDSGLKQITSNNANCEIAEVQPPDYDLRVAVLKEYAKRIKLGDNVPSEERRRELTDNELEVIQYIANIISDNDLQNNNLSEVLRVFKRVKIACELVDEEMTLDIVKKMLD